MRLSKNYRIVNEESNTILQFHEDRVKTKKDGTQEPYEFVDNYFYPNLKSALKAYVNKAVGDCKQVKEVLKKISELEDQITNLLKK
jgi:methionine salvage enolase-phosphatase E1